MKQDVSFGVIPMRGVGVRRTFLLVQHHAGHWGFPKGHAEPGEASIEAATRELAEETGLEDVHVAATPRFAEQYVFTKRSGRVVEKTVTYFLGTVRSGDVVVQAEEIRDFLWADAAATREQLSFDEARSLFDRVLEHLRRGGA